MHRLGRRAGRRRRGAGPGARTGRANTGHVNTGHVNTGRANAGHVNTRPVVTGRAVAPAAGPLPPPRRSLLGVVPSSVP
ncbi:hypothetical protein [Microbispora sp. NPDC046933]|uniref:hypothetical protein n=1 Tax=Microbispora sp. NPDC046933 TaxID=3155618 RepID=UPI00340C3873